VYGTVSLIETRQSKPSVRFVLFYLRLQYNYLRQDANTFDVLQAPMTATWQAIKRFEHIIGKEMI
jgi:hypothetical protein